MIRTALFSPCGRFRYRLGRLWAEGPLVAFVLLNPSTADDQVDDPTVRRCIDFARRRGFGGLEGLNLYAYRATDRAELRRAGYPVGPENDLHIEAGVSQCERVVLAWGVHAGRQPRPAEVLELLRDAGVPPYCLRLTTSGHPEHLLRLPKTCELRPFGGAASEPRTTRNSTACSKKGGYLGLTSHAGEATLPTSLYRRRHRAPVGKNDDHGKPMGMSTRMCTACGKLGMTAGSVSRKGLCAGGASGSCGMGSWA